VKILIVILLLSSCSLTTSILMKCKGDCELAVEREIEVKAVPDLPMPKGDR